jgi:pimeloyl-ACP methyl ester carboxylesterase
LVTSIGLADGLAHLVDRLGRGPAVFVGNDSGGALCQLVVAHHPKRVLGLVLTSCDAFEHYPPPMGELFVRLRNLPGLLHLSAFLFSSPRLQRWPLPLASLARRPIDADILASWSSPLLQDSRVRADVRAFLGSVHPSVLVDATEKLRAYRGPVLIAWSRNDQVFSPDLARRLADVFPKSELAWIDGANTYSPWDQPEAVAGHINHLLGQL